MKVGYSVFLGICLVSLASCASLKRAIRVSEIQRSAMADYVFTEDLDQLKRAANNQALTMTAMSRPTSLVKNHPYYYKGKFYSEQQESTINFAGGFSLVSSRSIQDEGLVGMDILYKDDSELLFSSGPYFYKIGRKKNGNSIEVYQVNHAVWQERPSWLTFGNFSISFGDDRVFDADRSLAGAERMGGLEFNVLERVNAEAARKLRLESEKRADQELAEKM